MNPRSTRPRAPVVLFVLCVLCVFVVSPSPAEEPKVAGTDVPAPKRTKTVMPEYPPEAQAEGIRGIVILELVIDPQGRVASAEVIRSIPALDEAALDAARKWEYEVTKVSGNPVSVRLTVPISFALKLPEVSRQDGIPELRQGAPAAYPSDKREESATVIAEVTLDADGAIADALITSGDSPWSDALLRAIRTWKFAVEDPETTVAFRVEARFSPGSKTQGGRVELRLSNPRRSKAAATPAATPAAPSAPRSPASPEPARGTETTAPAEPAPSTPATTDPASPTASPPTATPPTPGTPPVPSSKPPEPPPSVSPPPGSAPPPTKPAGAEPAATPAAPPAPTTAAPVTGAPPSTAGKPPADGRSQQPPIETLSVPPPKEPPSGPPENGVSAIRDVTLSPGVPDLVKGRRPVSPPLARMAGVTGTVHVRFAVNAAGIVSLQGAEGPELLKPAAQDAVTSWAFRRTSAERLRLVATFDYKADAASAAVSVDERTQ